MILKNLIFSIQSSGGAAEYANLCNKDQINFGPKNPIKNDGKEVYHENRDIIYDEYNANLREKFKVTVSRIPYNVLLTYDSGKKIYTVFILFI